MPDLKYLNHFDKNVVLRNLVCSALSFLFFFPSPFWLLAWFGYVAYMDRTEKRVLGFFSPMSEGREIDPWGPF